jgi:hypothetical protein
MRRVLHRPDSMRRRRRRVTTVYICVALALCTGIGSLWLRSFRTVDFYRGGRGAGLSYDGGIHLFFSNPPDWSKDRQLGYRSMPLGHATEGRFEATIRVAGFEYHHWETTSPARGHWRVRLPYVPIGAILVSPVVVVALSQFYRRVVRSHRRARGLCHVCGYDLQGGSDVCPECGSGMHRATASLRN